MTRPQAPYANWIHLDFKGMMPSEGRLLEWIDWLHARGFEGMVFEYEDRLPWKTLPGTFRGGLELAAWKRIWAHCREHGVGIAPLIQTYGHLQWLLKHKEWKHLRCGGHLNLLCPHHSETRPLLESWIREVADLHPDASYVHVGLDEIYHMGDCSVCREVVRESSEGLAGLLLDHASFVCEAVLRTGKRPIVWADMFFSSPDMIGRLPQGVILCDWKYGGAVGEKLLQAAENSTCEWMGASAIRRSFPTYNLIDSLIPRVENVRNWHQFAAARPELVKTVMHTVWARVGSLAPLYGPWDGWLPGFMIAGNPGEKLSAVLQRGWDLLEEGLACPGYECVDRTLGELQKLHSEDDFEERALRWWEFALRHHGELYMVEHVVLGYEAIRATSNFMGSDPQLIADLDEALKQCRTRIRKLGEDVEGFLRANEWTDIDEYIEGRFESLFRRLDARPMKVGRMTKPVHR